ncbi:hypothetical protein FDECE_11350 [Fusarium decemcellulare]|nr:hypothetical protein FDECE_11350 [Fusarium decemcellulare]
MDTNTAVADSELPKYACRTQDEEASSWGHTPISNLAGTTGDNAPDKTDSLVLGYGTIVPRWDVTIVDGRKLQYFVKEETFPDASKARTAAKQFQAAADSWTQLPIGINISETTEKESANFYLVYKVNKSHEKGALAQAFFPHEVGEDVIVFSYAFEGKNPSMLKNIFQHEIGHILGLRHEFAITGDNRGNSPEENSGAKQFLLNNYDSVMSYKIPPELQDTDLEQTIEFYKLPNGYLIDGSPITDYQPQVRPSK